MATNSEFSGPLKGIKVIEFAGLAPAPMCGMLLRDFGADVIRINKIGHKSILGADMFARGKKSIAVNLKTPEGVSIIKKLCCKSDVLIEPFRAGVMERLGLGPKDIFTENPRLIYARLTGFGQTGPLAKMAGHDMNFLAASGVLSMIGRPEEKPFPPLNLIGDFCGGSLTCAFGILVAIIERNQSGKGQVVDSNIVEGIAYLSSYLWRSRNLKILWGKPRGQNVLDSGYFFYETYKTKDDKYMAVAPLELEFYEIFTKALNLDIPQSGFNHTKGKEILTNIFIQKTQAEWIEFFKDKDACVTPVLSVDDAPKHPHNVERGSFFQGSQGVEPRPAPLLDRTPGKASLLEPICGQHTVEVLMDMGFNEDEIETLLSKDVIELSQQLQSK